MTTRQEKVDQIKDWLSKTKLDANVVNTTIGISASSITPQVLLQSSKKLLDISKGTAQVDDRDNLRFSKFLNMEDYVKEHIEKDAGKYQRKFIHKINQKKNLSFLHSGFFTPQIHSVVIGNALSENVEGINPINYQDSISKVTKLGIGGIPSESAIPDESRDVNSSSFGLLDPFRVSEDSKVGVNLRFADGVRKGEDGKLYRKMINKKGEEELVDHETLLNSICEIPEN